MKIKKILSNSLTLALAVIIMNLGIGTISSSGTFKDNFMDSLNRFGDLRYVLIFLAFSVVGGFILTYYYYKKKLKK